MDNQLAPSDARNLHNIIARRALNIRKMKIGKRVRDYAGEKKSLGRWESVSYELSCHKTATHKSRSKIADFGKSARLRKTRKKGSGKEKEAPPRPAMYKKRESNME